MDDTWRVKNSSTWTLPMPEILPSSLSPAIVPPMSTSSLCSANQMNMINRQCIFPLTSQAYNADSHATPQQPPIFPTLHLGVTDSGKSVTNNSFIAKTPHNLLDGISPLHKLHGHNSNTIVSNSYQAPQITGIYPLNESTNGSILNQRVHLLDESPSLLSKNFKSPNFLNELHFSPSNDRVINNNYNHHFHRQMNKIRFSPNLSSKTATVVPESILSRRRPRVICMTTVGELFLSELGLLGVNCYCHNMAMSVAKFCEHAGSSTNVAHAVHLESGMPIAQWRRLCFGNTAPDDDKGWDWPANSSTENHSVKYSVPLPLHPQTVGYVKTFSGLVNSLEEVSQTNHPVNAGYGSKGSYSIQSLFYPDPNSKSSITICKSPSEERKVSVNGHSSNSDLQLGQPPQIHISVSSFPTAMNPVQCKEQATHPSKENVFKANCHLDTKDPTSGFSYASYRSFTIDGGETQHAIKPINMIDGNANKDLSFYSLFQDYKQKENSASHNLSFGDRLSTAETGSNSLGGILPRILDKGKRARYFENAIHGQQNSDTKSSQQSLMVQFVQSNNLEPERSQMYINFTPKDNMPVNNCTYNPVSLISFSSGKSTVSTSPNSIDHSEIAFKSTHDQGISHGQKLFDGTMKQLALKPKPQRTCFHSGMDLQKDFCVADLEAIKSLRQGSLHDIKKINRSAQTSSKYLCQNELGKHAISTEGSSICFKKQDSSTCHACYASDHSCFRLEKQIFDKKERCHKKPFFGNCCSVLAKHMASCCLYKDFNSTCSLNNQNLCGCANISQFRQTCNEIHRFHDAKCKSKKQYFTSGQPGLWRDVPAKITDASLLKSSIGKVAKTAHCSESKMEEQMLDTYTDFPAPTLTEVSVAVNRETCSKYSDNRKFYDFVIDEESAVEKCGSSDEAAFSECDKINAVGANQDNNMKSKNQEQMETGSPPLKSESSHLADRMNLKLVSHDECIYPIQAHNVKQLSGLKRKEISGSLTDGFETNNKIKQGSSEKNKQIHVKESNHLDFRKPYKYISLNSIAKDGNKAKEIDKEVVNTKVKPVVCGKYGGLSGQKKPTKIVSLSSLLKRTKKCNANEYELLHSKSISSKTRKMFLLENNENNHASSHDLKDDTATQNGTTCGINTDEDFTRRECKKYQTRSRHKEVRSCSLSKLLAKDHHAAVTNVSIDVKDSGKRYLNNEVHRGELHMGTERHDITNFDASYCVCGKENKEEFSIMLECHRCLVKVHQTCYGISEVPLTKWLCRPCKINSQSTGPPQSEMAKYPKSECARTECFNGLKKVEAFNRNLSRNAYDGGKRCVVSQEQINAWAHINSLTSCRKTTVKPSSSDTDYEMTTQKEYVRYKQSKAWKNLVVYKSGIHLFGLYSSQFINRGTMVVEYVGEIIGQKVADKREKEYEAGNRLKYKSACYFFKIDKDNIIDATRKGGIARFVNHSCQPNCVAKIITVRSEKKVVFFATRDINPGEEITYDYHFNSEDEGEKIPCYCNSKNCRQYMN